MSTAAQIAANQANAQLSTGPVTEAGRAISSRNNLRHGFRSQTVLLPGDDPAEYDALLAELSSHFDHDDLTQQRFVREMADAEWRLRRVRQYMEAAISCRMDAIAAQCPGIDLIAMQGLALQSLDAEGGVSYSTWLRYETKYERQYERAYQGWCRYQQETRRARDKDADIMMREVLFQPSLVTEARRSASTVQTPRNALCPCNSGQKFKRCCGKTAPPVLHNPLREAA